MDPSFWPQICLLALVFVFALVPTLASRRMECGDMTTLIVITPVTFAIAVLPGILVWGFNKDSASYILGGFLIVTVAILNRRFQPGTPTRE
jgi:hypothetical protein